MRQRPLTVTEIMSYARTRDVAGCYREILYGLQRYRPKYPRDVEKKILFKKLLHDLSLFCLGNEKTLIEDLLKLHSTNHDAFTNNYLEFVRKIVYDKISIKNMDDTIHRLLPLSSIEEIIGSIDNFMIKFVESRYNKLKPVLEGAGNLLNPVEINVLMESFCFGPPIIGKIDLIRRIDSTKIAVSKVKIKERYSDYDALNASIYAMMCEDAERLNPLKPEIEAWLDLFPSGQSFSIPYQDERKRIIELVSEVQEFKNKKIKDTPKNENICPKCGYAYICD